MKSQEIAYIVLSFVLIATFIAIFFFTYVSAVEADIIKTQINNVITDFVSSTDLVLSPEQKTQVGNIIIANLSVPNMSEDDREAMKTNDNLLKKSMIVFGMMVGIGLIIVISMWYRYRFDILDIFKYSLIMLFVIAITEILFATFVIKNYKLIDDNYLYYLVITNLEAYANS
jgi:hypothetical protein